MELDKLAAVTSAPYYPPQQQNPYNQQTGTAAAKRAPSAADGVAAVPGNDSIQLSAVTLKNVDTIRTIEQKHTTMNQHIKGVRDTTEALNREATGIERMATSLNAIIKNFPPFPVSSKKRQELLMSYTSIRKELLKMAVPPPPQPVYEQVKNTWNSLFDAKGQMTPEAVPKLEQDSPDTAVQAASQGLDVTGRSLANLSSSVIQTLAQG